MDLTRLRFVLSQFRVPPSQHLREPRDMILLLEDLPQGWKVLDQRRWRTGISGEPWAKRARALGGITAWRSFQGPSHDRWLWVQATPYASDADAEAALNSYLDHGLENLGAQVRVVDTHEGPSFALPARSMKTVEQTTAGPAGRGNVRYVAWTHGSTFGAVCGSAFGDPWSWQQLQEIAVKQDQRIDAVISR